MSSPGLKRPLELELASHMSNPSGSNTNLPNSNGNKRRCTNYAAQSRADNPGYSSSTFKDPSSLLTPLSEDVASMIKDEIHKSHDSSQRNNIEPPVLTVRQTQKICERLIKEREQRLRDEYDKILISKLAEQYDTFVKYGHIEKRYNEPSPHIAPSLPDLSAFAAILSANGSSNALPTSHLAFNLQQQVAAAAMQAQQQRVSGANSSIPSGPVLLASNLDEQLAVPEALFTLFGVFGDVIRVKILFNKKDNALIQMADANQAQVAQGYLDKQRVFGKTVRVTRSKHQLVQMPREGNQSDAGLTKDFTNSQLHRFKIPGSRNYLNIYPPSNTLHISNIPVTIEESDIHKAFKDACGFEFSSFKFFPKDRKMALMKFDTIEHATIALIKMHNYQISEDNNLRVSFSKSVMQQ